MNTPRLRMFAGPNASGKSTIKALLPAGLIGIYINPDEIEKQIRQNGFLNLAPFGVQTSQTEVSDFIGRSALYARMVQDSQRVVPVLQGQHLSFEGNGAPSYVASIASDFIRHRLLELGASFSFETVMSSRDKIDFLTKARKLGYRTYLYYVATEDPAINASRVDYRVSTGGHNVPTDKIFQRYERSLRLLPEALKQTDRAYIFDNSGPKHLWLAEITQGKEVEFKTAILPDWLKKYLPGIVT